MPLENGLQDRFDLLLLKYERNDIRDPENKALPVQASSGTRNTLADEQLEGSCSVGVTNLELE